MICEYYLHCAWIIGSMCAVVIAALVINLTCSVFAVLHLRSGELYSSSNCHCSYRSSLDGMDAVIGRGGGSNQCRHYYQDSKAPDTGSRRGQRGARMGSWLPQLVKSTHSVWSEWVLAARCPTCSFCLRPDCWYLLPTFMTRLQPWTSGRQNRRSYTKTLQWSISMDVPLSLPTPFRWSDAGRKHGCSDGKAKAGGKTTAGLPLTTHPCSSSSAAKIKAWWRWSCWVSYRS